MYTSSVKDISIEKENSCSFSFSFQAIPHFYLMNALVYVDIDEGIYKVKMRKSSEWKMKKKIVLCTWIFFFYKYGKFWRILLGIFYLEQIVFFWIVVFNVNKGEFLCENDIRKDEKCQQKIPHLELDSWMRLVFFQ